MFPKAGICKDGRFDPGDGLLKVSNSPFWILFHYIQLVRLSRPDSVDSVTGSNGRVTTRNNINLPVAQRKDRASAGQG